MANRPWSLTPWSLAFFEGEAIEDSVDFLEYMDCVAGVSDEDYDAAEFRVRVESSIGGSSGAPDAADFDAVFSAHVVVSAEVDEKADYSASVEASKTDIEAVFNESVETAADFDGKIAISLIMTDSAALSAEMLTISAAGVIQYESITMTDILSVVIGVQTISQEVIRLNIALLPGQSIVLDANNYTAMLGEENALHLVDGWITLDNEVVEIFIDTGLGGELVGDLRYRERWY